MQNNQNNKKPALESEETSRCCALWCSDETGCSYINKYLRDVAFLVTIISRLLALVDKAPHTIPTLSLIWQLRGLSPNIKTSLAVVVEPTTSWTTLKCAVLAIDGLEVVVLKIMRRRRTLHNL